MKEIKKFEKVEPKQEVVQPVKEQNFLGTLKLEKGHKIFKFNMNTGFISCVEFKKEKKTYNVDKVVLKLRKKAKGEKFILLLNGEAEENRYKDKMTLIKEPGHIYCSALNIKNARKKFAKILISKNH